MVIEKSLLLMGYFVDIWYIDLQKWQNLKYTDCLSEDEKIRAGRYLKYMDRLQFTICRVLLRQILARYLGSYAGEISFTYGVWGKPTIRGNTLQFNISHSGRYLAVTVSDHYPVGIDIEKKQLIDMESMVGLVFSDSENSRWRMTAEEEKKDVFYRHWVRKEAILKAAGFGLHLPMQALELDENGQILNFHEEMRDFRDYKTFDFIETKNVIGSVALPNFISIRHLSEITPVNATFLTKHFYYENYLALK